MSGDPGRTVRFLSFHKFHPSQPAVNLGNIIVIPARQEPDIGNTIASLAACHPPHHEVEVLVVFNASDKDTEEVIHTNRHTYAVLSEMARDQGRFPFRLIPVLYEGLPAKKTGAGLARRLGFDEAARRFLRCNNPAGVITSLDADTLVDQHYLISLEEAFSDEQTTVATLCFAHPLSGNEFPDEVYYGIVRYELHLRYFVRALRYIGYPWAYHTVGSAFAVRSASYVKEGGMNLRKAGEDFYFLQKMFKSGKVKEITTACVYPSPRPSGRVPFGTGPEILRFLTEGKKELLTYSLEAFLDLRTFFTSVGNLYRSTENDLLDYINTIPGSLQVFLDSQHFIEKMQEIRSNVATSDAFVKRFFRWFDAFKVIKFLNQMHDGTFYTKYPVETQAGKLLEFLENPVPADISGLLEQYRFLDRQKWEDKR